MHSYKCGQALSCELCCSICGMLRFVLIVQHEAGCAWLSCNRQLCRCQLICQACNVQQLIAQICSGLLKCSIDIYYTLAFIKHKLNKSCNCSSLPSTHTPFAMRSTQQQHGAAGSTNDILSAIQTRSNAPVGLRPVGAVLLLCCRGGSLSPGGVPPNSKYSTWAGLNLNQPISCPPFCLPGQKRTVQCTSSGPTACGQAYVSLLLFLFLVGLL